jgi:hypothetical protein
VGVALKGMMRDGPIRRRARGPLLDLVLDAGDTFVTRATAMALLQRHDSAGLAVVASALATADRIWPF